MSERYFRNGNIPWVKTLDLNNSEVRSTEEQITQAALSETSLQLYPAGSVLVAMYGGYNQIGRTGILTIPATINQALTAIRPDPQRLNSSYLLRVLNYRVNHWKLVASSSRKDPNVTGKDVAEFPVAVPSIAEQQAIAQALSCADAHIEVLEQLIAKKHHIKQGAMQELLTGRSRLSGFEVKPGYKQTETGPIPKDWGTALLGAHFSFKNGLNKGKQYFGHGTPIVNYMDVYRAPGIQGRDLNGRVDVSRQELDSFGVKRGDVSARRARGPSLLQNVARHYRPLRIDLERAYTPPPHWPRESPRLLAAWAPAPAE